MGDSLDISNGIPQVFIQYKGTELCADVECECGADWHIDGMFVHAVECPVCHERYSLPHTIPLLPPSEFDLAHPDRFKMGQLDPND